MSKLDSPFSAWSTVTIDDGPITPPPSGEKADSPFSSFVQGTTDPATGYHDSPFSAWVSGTTSTIPFTPGAEMLIDGVYVPCLITRFGE